jgi:hypothetical protein
MMSLMKMISEDSLEDVFSEEELSKLEFVEVPGYFLREYSFFKDDKSICFFEKRKKQKSDYFQDDAGDGLESGPAHKVEYEYVLKHVLNIQ